MREADLTSADLAELAAKLSARSVWADGPLDDKIGKSFGVAKNTIGNIANGATWRHLETEEAA